MTLPVHLQNSGRDVGQSHQSGPTVYGPSWKKLLFDLFSELVDQEAREVAATVAAAS